MVPAWALLLLAQVAASVPFRPHAVRFEDLVDSSKFAAPGMRGALEQALSEVGVVTVSGIPKFGELRQQVLRGAHRCLQVLPEDLARGHRFDDGTLRKTMALLSNASYSHDLQHTGAAACADLEAPLGEFRRAVGDAAAAFAARVAALLDLSAAHLRQDSGEDKAASYEDFRDFFQHGEHLEHIHAYHLPKEHQGSNAATMDFHTDQGLCIAFTPALLVEEHGDLAPPGAAAGRFEIQLRGGERVAVDVPSDHLVFMLGDGVDQYINPRKVGGSDLRAVPHALTMPAHAGSQWRLWYGRMFLPPADAVSEASGLPYGELRGRLASAWLEEEEEEDEESGALPAALALGCSRGQRAVELRQLSEDPPCASGSRRRCSGSCANNQLQCWWRCMNFTADVSPDSCAAKGSGFNCTNARDEISIGGIHHGNYYTRCTNSSQLVRPNCELPQINALRPPGASATGFETFLAAQARLGGYAGRKDLLLDAGNSTEVAFMWKITAEGKVDGLMAYNGMLSWMAWGLENMDPSSGKNGMQGAPVLFGISSSDTEYAGFSGSVKEYRIHDSQSRFDMWNTEHDTPATTHTEMVEENGYSAMKFRTDSICGSSLNVSSGPNRLIWAIRASSYMQVGKDSYHEGCDGTERKRYRGGGRVAPWVVDFAADIADNPLASGGLGAAAPGVLALASLVPLLLARRAA